jgi:glycosyltransferase involved in cell wall biosynthesis
VRAHSGDPYRWLAREGDALNAVMLCRLPVAISYLPSVRRFSPKSKVIFDTVDLHFVRERRAAEVTGNRRLARQALRSQRQELAMVKDCDTTFVVSAEERDILAREVPLAHIERVSIIHEVTGQPAPFETRKGLLFVGGFGHPPNEDAVNWFVREVLPKVGATDPDITLHVVGDVHDAARRSLRAQGVVVHGRVDNLEPLYASIRLSIAPLRFGAGVKGKVTQAMSHGLPVVLTTVAAEGMHLRHEVTAMIVDTPDAMADAIKRTYYDRNLWYRLSEAGLENVRYHFSPDQAREALMRGLGE